MLLHLAPQQDPSPLNDSPIPYPTYREHFEWRPWPITLPVDHMTTRLELFDPPIDCLQMSVIQMLGWLMRPNSEYF